MMPGEKPFKTKLLSPQLGCSRLSFAPPEFMEEILNCTPGSASVLGLLFDKELRVRLIIDKDLLNEEFIGCHPCDNSSSLKIKTEDIIKTLLPNLDHTPTFVEL
jgi:Ala-tRNA(Pro) deacylase